MLALTSYTYLVTEFANQYSPLSILCVAVEHSGTLDMCTNHKKAKQVAFLTQVTYSKMEYSVGH